MSSNSKTEYNEFIRANLPAEITYDEVRAQYVTINGKRFPTYLQAKWYIDYIKKFGFSGFSVYAILSLEPPLVLDFDESYFRTGGTATDLVSAATHTRAGNATMVDSDGFRKWAPHNLVTYSEQFDNAAWTKVNGTATATTFTASADSNQHYVFNSATVPIGSTVTVKATVDARVDGRFLQVCFGSGDVGGNPYVNFDLSDGTISSDLASIASIQATVTLGVYEITLEILSAATDFQVIVAAIESGSSPRLAAYDATGTTATYGVTKFHIYRSDLGGMVDNPATGDSYVPTTDSSRFLPRVGHHIWNGSAWADEGYFHESEARTNLVTESNDFTSAGGYWSSGGNAEAIALTTDTTSPTGAADAYALIAKSTGGTGVVSSFTGNVSVGTSTTYTYSEYFKRGGVDWVQIAIASFTTPADGGCYFDLLNGVVGTADSGLTGKIESAGNGWYRCSIAFTTDAADGGGTIVKRLADADGDNVVALDGTSSIYNFGAQFEAGSTPSSYIPTAGAEVTRAADAMTIPAANLPWNPLAVSIQMEGTMTYADEDLGAQFTFYRWLKDSGNFIDHRLVTASSRTGEPQPYQRETSSGQDNVGGLDIYSPGINVPFNIASRHGSTFINGAVGGTALTANLTPTALPDLSATDLNLGFDFMGTIKLFRVWADDLTDEGIAEASA